MKTKLLKTFIEGVYQVISKPFYDNRGAFLNLYRANEESYLGSWANYGINQVNLSETKKVGSIRGIHLQRKPHGEKKLIRCIKGEVWDVAVDLRDKSKTYGKWVSVRLSEKENNGIIIPDGCAHGFQTLEHNSKLLYLHSGNWIPEAETGVRWNDPMLNIDWPLEISEISPRDEKLPFLKCD